MNTMGPQGYLVQQSVADRFYVALHLCLVLLLIFERVLRGQECLDSSGRKLKVGPLLWQDVGVSQSHLPGNVQSL